MVTACLAAVQILQIQTVSWQLETEETLSNLKEDISVN